VRQGDARSKTGPSLLNLIHDCTFVESWIKLSEDREFLPAGFACAAASVVTGGAAEDEHTFTGAHP
jgi:hypothetical protein